tara:strand:+ start:3953 stop:4576 length:624 start_codon:yes stop_codon:yes gene_type:complete
MMKREHSNMRLLIGNLSNLIFSTDLGKFLRLDTSEYQRTGEREITHMSTVIDGTVPLIEIEMEMAIVRRTCKHLGFAFMDSSMPKTHMESNFPEIEREKAKIIWNLLEMSFDMYHLGWENYRDTQAIETLHLATMMVDLIKTMLIEGKEHCRFSVANAIIFGTRDGNDLLIDVATTTGLWSSVGENIFAVFSNDEKSGDEVGKDQKN